MMTDTTEAKLAAELVNFGDDLHRLKEANREAVDAVVEMRDRIEEMEGASFTLQLAMKRAGLIDEARWPGEDLTTTPLQEGLRRHVLPGLMPYVSPTVSAAAKLAEALAQRPPAGIGLGGADVPRALRWLADVVEASHGQ